MSSSPPSPGLLDPDLHTKCLSLLAPGGQLILDIATPLLADRKEFAVKARLAHPNEDIVVPKHPTLFPESHTPRKGDHLAEIRHIVCVSSGKGGVGKSTVSVNLAAALHSLGCRVGLFDADLHGPSLPTMMVRDRWQVEKQGKYLNPVLLHGIQCMSFGFVSPGTGGQGLREDGELIKHAKGPLAAIMRGPMASKTVMELVTHTRWGELDFLIVDLPPGTGDIHLSLMQDLAMDAAVVVTTPQELSFVDVARGLDMLEQMKIPVVSLVQNMAWFTCRHGERHFPFGSKGEAHLKRLSKAYGIKSLTALPIVASFSDSGDSGVPFMLTPTARESDLEAYNTYTNLALDVCRQVIQLKSPLAEAVPKVTYDAVNNLIVMRTITAQGASQVKIPPQELRNRMRQVDDMLNLTFADDSVTPKHIEQRGKYAVSITWSDGHSTSIYPYDQLKLAAEQYQNGEA